MTDKRFQSRFEKALGSIYKALPYIDIAAKVAHDITDLLIPDCVCMVAPRGSFTIALEILDRRSGMSHELFVLHHQVSPEDVEKVIIHELSQNQHVKNTIRIFMKDGA